MIFKIKDYIDLKELEHYGFILDDERLDECYVWGIGDTSICISVNSRKIMLFKTLYKNEEVIFVNNSILNKLYDLILEGLVEKC